MSEPGYPAHEVVHQCPPGDEALMPCCGLSPFEVPPWHRITITETVTCPAALAPPTTEGEEGEAKVCYVCGRPPGEGHDDADHKHGNIGPPWYTRPPTTEEETDALD